MIVISYLRLSVVGDSRNNTGRRRRGGGGDDGSGRRECDRRGAHEVHGGGDGGVGRSRCVGGGRPRRHSLVQILHVHQRRCAKALANPADVSLVRTALDSGRSGVVAGRMPEGGAVIGDS